MKRWEEDDTADMWCANIIRKGWVASETKVMVVKKPTI